MAEKKAAKKVIKLGGLMVVDLDDYLVDKMEISTVDERAEKRAERLAASTAATKAL